MPDEPEGALPDYLGSRTLPDGRGLDVVPLTFGRARLLISRNREWGFYDDGW